MNCLKPCSGGLLLSASELGIVGTVKEPGAGVKSPGSISNSVKLEIYENIEDFSFLHK